MKYNEGNPNTIRFQTAYLCVRIEDLSQHGDCYRFGRDTDCYGDRLNLNRRSRIEDEE